MIYGIIFILCVVISWQWVKAIDNMKNLHPDYKGEDQLIQCEWLFYLVDSRLGW